MLGSELFYMAFMDLTSSRSLGYMSPGPIPWHAIHLYCEANGVTGEQREDVFYHVEHLDKLYLDWLTKKHKQQLAAHAPKPQPTKRSRR